MQDLSRTEFFTLEAIVIGFYTFLCGLLAIKVAIKVATNRTSTFRYSQRYTFYVWILGVFCITTMFGVWMIVRFPTLASNIPNSPQQKSCPCSETVENSNNPSTVPEESPTTPPTPTSNKVNALSGVDFAVDNRRYDYTPNALMGKFEGKYRAEPDGIKISIPSPIIRLAGSATTMGDREILSVEVAIGEHKELAEIAKTRRMEGDAYWSEPFELKNAMLFNGDEHPINQTVELSVSMQDANLTRKALLIKIHNRLVGTSEELFPGYVLSDSNVFSSH